MKNKSIFNPFYWPSLFIGFGKDIYRMISSHVEQSVRLQLVLAFAICLGLATIASAASTPFFAQVNDSYIQYDYGREAIDNQTLTLLNSLEAATNPDVIQEGVTQEQTIKQLFEVYTWNRLKILIVDLDGMVLHKSHNATETQVDLHGIIRNAMSARYHNNTNGMEYVSFYPINFQEARNYLIVSGIPEATVVNYTNRESMLPYLVGIIVFIVCFFWLTKRKTKYIEELAGGLMEFSKGNLDFRMAKKSNDELGVLAQSMNEMAEVLQRTIAEERQAEKTKTELITNVSHDLRTPLTLIMGYLRLLKDRNYTDEQQADSYLNIAYNKSEKLKGLIEDLFEYTKLTNSQKMLNLKTVCLNELIEQLLEEHVTHVEANQLTFYRVLPTEKIWIHIDADKIIRVFDNLITNAVNYSYRPGQIKVAMLQDKGFIHVCISNRGNPIPQAELERVFERFYRLDESRSSESGSGSGLGLAIAKSIIDHHEGRIWAECDGEDIRFWVRLKL